MNSKNVILVLIVLVLIVGAGIYFVQMKNSGTVVPSDSGTYSFPTNPAANNPSPAPSAGSAQSTSTTPAITTTTTVTTTTPAPMPATHPVAIQNFAFSPASITVQKGDTVVWTNMDTAAHTVTATGTNGGPNSGTLNQNQSYSYTFNSTGTFSYKCSFHPSMVATVTVVN